MTYNGVYRTRNGEHIPYVMEIEDCSFVLKYDVNGKSVVKQPRVVHAKDDIVWRVKGNRIQYLKAENLIALFENFDAFANATFRHFAKL